MKTFLVYQFELQPRPGETSRECLAAARDEVAEWVRRQCRYAGVDHLSLAFDGTTEEVAGQQLVSDEREAGTHRLTSLRWDSPDPSEPMKTWRLTATLACDAQAVVVVLELAAFRSTFAVRPLAYNLDDSHPLAKVPGLRDQLLRGREARIGGQPLPTRARRLYKSHVDPFVRDVLFHPGRVLPVILLNFDTPLRLDDAKLQDIQQEVLTLAHIAALHDGPAVERFTKQVGPDLTCRGVPFRLYWPGCTRDGPTEDHFWQSFETLQKNLQKTRLGHMVVTMLAPVTAEQYRPGPILRAAHAALDERRRADAATAQHFREAQESIGTLTAELERTEDENRLLREEAEDTRRRLAELETDFRAYLESTARWEARDVADTPALAADSGRQFANVAEALRAAAVEFADILTVWEEAEESATQSPFAMPAKIIQALRAVAEVGRAYFLARDGGLPLGPLDRAFLRRVPFKYTGFESQTTLSLFGAERVFHHRGQSRQMQRHLTLGGGTTNNCLQIYFEFDDTTRRVLIGYCGRHLNYARQRT
jgi:hypothetical protein